jgi:phosphatidylserine/phosphatidylglycerophosphate/cardiolipin synthase-like enzyme
MDDTPHHFHHKFVVLDSSRLLNGSYNWTRSGDRYNHENLMLTTDPRLVHKYIQAFEEMWAELGPPRAL